MSSPVKDCSLSPQFLSVVPESTMKEDLPNAKEMAIAEIFQKMQDEKKAKSAVATSATNHSSHFLYLSNESTISLRFSSAESDQKKSITDSPQPISKEIAEKIEAISQILRLQSGS